MESTGTGTPGRSGGLLSAPVQKPRPGDAANEDSARSTESGSVQVLKALLRAQAHRGPASRRHFRTSAASDAATPSDPGPSRGPSTDGRRDSNGRGGGEPSTSGPVTTPGLPARTGTGYPLPPAPLPFMWAPGAQAPARRASKGGPVRGEPLGPIVPERREEMQALDSIKLAPKQPPGAASSSSAPPSSGSPPPTPAPPPLNRVVYDSVDPSPQQTSRRPELSRLCGLDPALAGLPWYLPSGPRDATLVFESRFESGNLRRAIQVQPWEYDLVLRPDLNTRGHTQWYYFSIGNVRKGAVYRLNMINLQKDDSLYNWGMRPCVFSIKGHETRGEGWRRGGEDICYYRNSFRKRVGGRYFTLTFTITPEHDGDTLYLAHCYPYSYTDLQLYLSHLELRPGFDRLAARRLLCTSPAGNRCDVLRITDSSEDAATPLERRRAVVISARVHPGETPASLMVKGVMDLLTDPNSVVARHLRGRFVFYVVPMLNADGVVNGNYRCGLAGVDMNRVWDRPQARPHPEVHHLRSLLTELCTRGEVFAFVDLHGHSRRKDVFMYGCEHRQAKDYEAQGSLGRAPGSIGVCQGIPMQHQEKVLPWLLHKRNPRAFSFRAGSWKVQRSKDATARVVGWRELGLVNSFTMEASFCGPGGDEPHFSPEELEELGRNLCEAIYDLDRLSANQPGLIALSAELEREVDMVRGRGGGDGAMSDSEGSDEGLPPPPWSSMNAGGTGEGGEGQEPHSAAAGRRRGKRSSNRKAPPPPAPSLGPDGLPLPTIASLLPLIDQRHPSRHLLATNAGLGGPTTRIDAEEASRSAALTYALTGGIDNRNDFHALHTELVTNLQAKRAAQTQRAIANGSLSPELFPASSQGSRRSSPAGPRPGAALLGGMASVATPLSYRASSSQSRMGGGVQIQGMGPLVGASPKPSPRQSAA